MGLLGVYFGPKAIRVVEAKGRKILNQIDIATAAISSGDLEEKVPEDIKTVALFKEELRRRKISTKKVNLVLSGRDIVVRNFEMSALSRDELTSAVNFEAKKYLPFKTEELILDSQLTFDKTLQKNLVLLAGVKKEVYNKYWNIFKQLNMEIESIEYSAFSLLRLLKMAGLTDKGVIAVLSADLAELDEVNFTVTEEGLPLFSRDIAIASEQDAASIPQAEPGMLTEKLKTELRISLDYYQRKFPVKKIESLYFIGSKDYQPELEPFSSEIGLNIKFVDTDKCVERPSAFSLSLLKAYAGSLSDTVKLPIKIDILAAQKKQVSKGRRETHAGALGAEDLTSLAKGISLDPKMVILGLLICGGVFVRGIYQKMPIQQEIQRIKAERPRVKGISPNSSYEQLLQAGSSYKDKLTAADNAVRKQFYLTRPLNSIPALMPQGLWLSSFSFNENNEGTELVLKGIAFVNDENKEFELVNEFLQKLKQEEAFTGVFNSISLVSMDRSLVGNDGVTNFTLSCRGGKRQK